MVKILSIYDEPVNEGVFLIEGDWDKGMIHAEYGVARPNEDTISYGEGIIYHNECQELGKLDAPLKNTLYYSFADLMKYVEISNETVSADYLLENAHIFDIEGWWEATKDGAHRQFARIRLDTQRQEYVLDVVGQRLSESEYLWRYKGGDWQFISHNGLTLPKE